MLFEDVRSLAEPEGLAKDGDATIAAQASLVPQVSAMAQSVPNPFRVRTVVNYQVAPPGGHVKILIFDAAGRRVRTLVDRETPPGYYNVPWDGRNDDGRYVSTEGDYTVVITATEPITGSVITGYGIVAAYK